MKAQQIKKNCKKLTLELLIFWVSTKGDHFGQLRLYRFLRMEENDADSL